MDVEMTKDLSLLTPVEIDTELARLWEVAQVNEMRAAQMRATMDKVDRLPYRREQDAKLLADYEAKLAEALAEAAPFEAEFARRGGWKRYFLVKNDNGHVHRGMNCTTCFPTTRYGWLIELADCDEDAMIEEWGEMACTVCFPSAPANPRFHQPSRRDAEARAARDAEKAAKAAEKASKALPGGTLRVGYDVLQTKVAARNALSQAVQNYCGYGPTHPSDFLAQAKVIAKALEGTEIDVAQVIERAEKKARKDGWHSHDFPGLEATS